MSTLDKLGGAGSADGRLLTALPVAEASPCQCQAMRARMKDATKRSRPTPRTHGKCRMLGWSQMPSTPIIRCSATVETGTSAARRRRYSRLVNGISPFVDDSHDARHSANADGGAHASHHLVARGSSSASNVPVAFHCSSARCGAPIQRTISATSAGDLASSLRCPVGTSGKLNGAAK